MSLFTFCRRFAGGPFRLTRPVLLLACAVSVAGFTACGDDDDDPAEEEHLDAVGVALVFGADTLVRATSGDVADVSGMLTLTLGDTLGPCRILFLNDEGAWFIPEEEEHGQEGEEDHGVDIRSQGGFTGFADPETWQAWFVPETVGTSSFRLAVTHEGHDDYVSPLLPVSVVGANP